MILVLQCLAERNEFSMNKGSEIFDVLVAGGGPAGATVALCLTRRGLRVQLVEASSYQKSRYGETLPPEMNPVLRELGLSEPFEQLSSLPAHGIVSAWGDAMLVEMDFLRNVHGNGWHVDRREFDRMLVREAEKAGARIELGRRVNAQRGRNGVWLTADCSARLLVDATGRNGMRIDGSAERELEDELIAIVLTLQLKREPGTEDLRTYIEAAPDGWWYIAPVPQGRVIVMFFTDPTIYREDGILMSQQLERAPLVARRLAGGRILDSQVLRVSSSCRREMFGDRWLAVGDSAFSVDPISGRGIFNAMRWAEDAAGAIADALDRDRQALGGFAARMRRQYDEYVRQRRTYYSLEQRWSELKFWRQRSVRRVPR